MIYIKNIDTNYVFPISNQSLAQSLLKQKNLVEVDQNSSNMNIIDNSIEGGDINDLVEEFQKINLNKITKDKLELWAKDNLNLDLDKRKKKTDLINIIKEHLNINNNY